MLNVVETSHGAMPQTDFESLEDKYFEIEALYDLAEELVDTVESDFVADPAAQLNLVEPLANVVGEAADVLSDEFMAYAEASAQGKKHKGNKNRVEGALRKVFSAIDNYKEAAAAQSEGAYNGLRNIADLIVKKVKRQMEAIVSLFIDFVDLSLDRIMHKTAIEELKQRQEKIAMMLHNLGQSPIGG